MSQLQDVQRFVDDMRHVRTPRGLKQLMSDAALEMGFDHFSMIKHVDLSACDREYRHKESDEVVCINNAPSVWSDYYRGNNLLAVDPRVVACRRTVRPFLTGEVGRLVQMTSAQRDYLERQKRADIGEGFTIPMHSPDEPAGSCTFAMMYGRALPTENLAMAHFVGIFAFDAFQTMRKRHGRYNDDDQPRLTERQLQCTLLVARGLSETDIARRLGIATQTVKRHLKEARQTYGVTKSIQLVTKSLRDGKLSIADLFD